MDIENRQLLKGKLQKEHKDLAMQISSIEEHGLNASMSESLGELSMYDNHPADVAAEMFERSKDIGLQDNARIMLEEVDRALEKINNNTYGYCERCGQEIDFERLKAVPWAENCLKCQQQIDIDDDFLRPLEEEILSPPLKRTFLDNTDYTGFDGEDAAQAVFRYGSSDSPQDIPGAHDYKDLYPNNDEHEGIVERTDAIPAGK